MSEERNNEPTSAGIRSQWRRDYMAVFDDSDSETVGVVNVGLTKAADEVVADQIKTDQVFQPSMGMEVGVLMHYGSMYQVSLSYRPNHCKGGDITEGRFLMALTPDAAVVLGKMLIMASKKANKKNRE
jgi:hypothetical protein